MLTITSPYVHIADLSGDPLDDGSVYIGTAGLNAETNPITVYWDSAGTQPAAQPIKTRSGVVARDGSPARVYTTAGAYSITVRNKQGVLIASELSISSSVDASGITDGTIAEVKLDAALAAKVNGALQKTGGTMTGAITLAGNATNALDAVPKQQLDSSVAAVQSLVAGQNRIINGTFAVNQRAFAGGARTAGQYGHDRWKAGSGGATYTVGGESATITAGTLVQVIEGVNVPEGGSYVLSWSGTAQARVDGGSYAASPITVTGKIPGVNITIEFSTGTVSKVQFEAGGTATTYERRMPVAESALCQRYFYRRSEGMGGAANATGQVFQGAIYHPVQMRAAPTVSASSVGLANGSAFSVGSPSATLYMAFITVAGAGPAFAQWVIDSDAEL